MAKVSIIIPIYNVEKYMRKSVDSVINQTEKDIEIILVDDGSTDSSGVLCDKYASQDNRIKVIHKENGGLSSARNAGIEEAASDYILLLDGDDYLKSDAVEILLSVADKYPSDIIQFMYREVSVDEKVSDLDVQGEIVQTTSSYEAFINLYEQGGVYASGCTKLFKKTLLKKIPFMSIRHEDEMWCTQAFANPLTITYIPNTLYYYVMRDSSIIHSKFNISKFDIFKVCRKRIVTLFDLGFEDLVHYEYERVFSSIIRLYIEAKKSDDKLALALLKDVFNKNRLSISKYAHLGAKFKTLFYLMQVNFSTINLYALYWLIKGNRV